MTLAAHNASLRLSGVTLLDNASIELQPGEVTAVLGPNGAGKTSLLRVLVGELALQDGSVTLSGKALALWPARLKARSVAVLPQHSLLDFPFTASEVVLLGRTPHETGKQRDEQIVTEALAAVDATHLAARFYTQLSGGEKQRVQLARVLAQIWDREPDNNRFLILDEPTSSFDLAHQQLTLDVVRQLAGDGVGVLMVLHDLNLAARCADRIVLMCGGLVVQSGSPHEVLNTQTISSVFGVDVSIGIHPVTGTPLVIT